MKSIVLIGALALLAAYAAVFLLCYETDQFIMRPRTLGVESRDWGNGYTYQVITKVDDPGSCQRSQRGRAWFGWQDPGSAVDAIFMPASWLCLVLNRPPKLAPYMEIENIRGNR